MGRARRVHANDGGAGCGRTARWAYSLASRAGDRATTRSDTISAAIGDVTGSRSCSVASKTGAASRPATIAGRAPSFPPLPSRPRLYSHRDQRVLTLAMCAERLQGPKPAERGWLPRRSWCVLRAVARPYKRQRRPEGRRVCVLVAGTGFEPVTFRL